MGFAQGSVSLRRFYLVGQHPETLTDDWLKRLEAHAFGSQGFVTSDGVETGWIGPDHLFDMNFTETHRFTVGRYIHLALRVDRTAPPPSIVASYRKEEELAALSESDEPFLSRADRRAARDAALAKAEAEARAGKFRRIAAYPLLIDLEGGVVLFSSGSAAACDRLMSLFSETFDISLVPADMDELSFRLAEQMGSAVALDAVKPVMLAEADLADRVDSEWGGDDRQFLAQEFLAWLLYRCQTSEGVFDLDGCGQVMLNVERSLNLRCPSEVSGTTTVRCDAPAIAPETKAALRIGKLPTRVGLTIAARADDWSLTLDAERLMISGLKIAPPEEKDAVLEYRFDQICDAQSTVDELVRAFLAIRLESKWDAELTGMQRWASGRPKPTEEPLRMASA